MSDQQRLLDLLADNTTFGLGRQERNELNSLLSNAGPDVAAAGEDFEQIAAAFYLATGAATDDQLPGHLRDQILRDAAQSSDAAPPAGAQNRATATRSSSVSPPRQPSAPATNRADRLPWSIAVAASLLVSVLIGDRLLERSPHPVGAAWVEPTAPLTRVSWSPTDDPASVADASGEVVWSDSSQSGYMTFTGLVANDPTVEQYQLWVFDEKRSAAHPVDGGVFNIPSHTVGEEIRVPIDPKLPIDHAIMFAITVERPGGVVVSDRSRLPLLAQVE